MKKKIFKIQNKTIKFDIVVSTVSPHIFKNKFGELPYIGRDIFKIVLPKEHVFQKMYIFYTIQIMSNLQGWLNIKNLQNLNQNHL